MVIVKGINGLGNQLFEYALYRKLIWLGKDAYFDDTWFHENEAEGGKYQLDLFQTNIRLVTKEHLASINKVYYEKEVGVYDDEVFRIDNIYPYP